MSGTDTTRIIRKNVSRLAIIGGVPEWGDKSRLRFSDGVKSAARKRSYQQRDEVAQAQWLMQYQKYQQMKSQERIA